MSKPTWYTGDGLDNFRCEVHGIETNLDNSISLINE